MLPQIKWVFGPDVSGVQLALGCRQCNVKLGPKKIARLTLVRSLSLSMEDSAHWLSCRCLLTPREVLFYCSSVCPVIMVAWFNVVLSLLILCMVPPKIVVSVTMPKTTVSCPRGPSGWLRGVRQDPEGTCWSSPYPVPSELFQISVLPKSAF